MPKDLIISGIKPLIGRVTVSWKWYDQVKGTVEYTFSNVGQKERSVVLYRSGYYFGNAYFPVYLANKGFNTSWSENKALEDLGAENNSAPVAPVNFNGQYLIAFVFTLSPGQVWSMLEGGFQGAEPTGVVAYPVSSNGMAEFCVLYDKEQVVDWDEQTGTSLKGFAPNPKSVKSAYYACSANYVQLFNDVVTKGKCGGP